MKILKKWLFRYRKKGRGLKEFEPKYRRARIWSNIELKKIAPKFSGDVINVSGWADEDKQGSTYKEYFVKARTYTISNYGGGFQIGKKIRLKKSIDIDLNKPLDKQFHQKFDVVFTHTVLEHIFNIFIAIKNLCMLSRDVIITVIPFIQPIHICNNKTNSYFDYWRFTPYCLDALFSQHGFSTIYISGTNLRSTSLYYLHICSRNPNRWKKIFPDEINFDELPRGHIFYE